jgi:hypothetical protein
MSPTESATPAISAENIMEMATGFWASKALFTATELGVFDALADGPARCSELAARLGLPERSLQRLLTAAAALGLLKRVGAAWANTEATGTLLVASSPEFVGGLFGHLDHDLYPLWAYLADAVRQDGPRWKQAFGPDAPDNPFEAMYQDPARLRQFLHCMEALSRDADAELAERWDFSGASHLLDVGGALGAVPLAVLSRHPHMTATVVDLPPVAPLAEQHIAEHGMAGKVHVVPGDFFAEPLPAGADVITLGYVLDDWADERCEVILRRCFDALAPGGTVLVLEKVLHDDRTGPVSAALMNLNMLVATEGQERTLAEYAALLAAAGFANPQLIVLEGSRDIVSAQKPLLA